MYGKEFALEYKLILVYLLRVENRKLSALPDSLLSEVIVG
jgi:hypothetical protein